MVLASLMMREHRAQREAWLNSKLRAWAVKHGIPIEEFPKHYERAEGFAIGYAKGHEKGFEIGYDKGIVAATARVEVRNTLNAKLRALAKEYGIPEDKLPLADEDDD